MLTKGIGLIGLGSITDVHTTAYAKFGLPLVAGYDPAPAARERFAQRCPDVRLYASLDELLADPRVAVVDVATPHYRASRVPVLATVAAARKPAFIQKPLAMTYADALEIADAFEKAGVPTMVNQNMCFTPGALGLPHLLLEDKVVGAPFLAHLELRFRFDCAPEHWFGKDERWWTIGLTVHHLGLLQMLFGPPVQVYAVTGKDPAQPGVTHDGYGHLVMTYATGLHLTLLSTGTYYGLHPIGHTHEQLWVQGPLGIIDWTPQDGYAVTLRANLDSDEPAQRTQVAGKWFPDAFGLGMAHFQQALAAGAAPLCSVQDNLYVMAVIEATYRSTQEKRAVDLTEIMGDRYDSSYGSGWFHGYRAWQPPAIPANAG